MKTNTIRVTSSEENNEVVMVMKKKKFPWWIFLLLLPLILLIPVKREIRIQFTEQESNIAIAKTAAKVIYPEVSTFGSKTPISVSDTTDTEGKFIITGVKEPLWYKLFGGASDSLFASCSNGCNGINNAGFKYREFPPDNFKIIEVGALSSVETLKVVDYDDNEPIPDANVQIIKTINDRATNSDTQTNPAGEFDINEMPVCGTIKVIASREGYLNDTLEATLRDLNNMTDAEKVLRLRPEKGCVKIIVKNLKTKTLLADATVTLEINGASRTLKTNTNGVGVGVFDSLRIASTLKFTGSKKNYADTTLSGYTVKEFMTLDEEKRTMYLRPLTQSLVFINTDNTSPLPGVKNEIYKNGTLIATEYSNNKGEFVVGGILGTDKISIVASKTGYNTNATKVKNKTLNDLNTQESRTIPLTKKEEPKPTPPPNPPNNRQDDLKGESGDLRINLQWYCKTDLDLHVIDPCGNEIYFSRRKATCNGGTGILDLDANALFGTTSRPQENIYWLKPAPGVYTVKVVCFKWREGQSSPISFNVSVVDRNGRTDKRGTIAAHQTVVVLKHTVR